MKSARIILLIACVVVSWGYLQTDVQAQTLGCYGEYGFAHPGFFGYSASPYSLGLIPTPPYYAIHPPVYYSHPVPRTYGYSPYAYPGTVETPEIVQPEMIENPHVENPVETEPAVGIKTVQYQVIDNPYVRAELRQSPHRVAAVSTR